MEKQTSENQTQVKKDSEEFEIIQNKLQYISLNEDSSSCVDITSEINDFIKTLSNGEMVHTSDFTLESTMSALELNHPKMDFHCHNENVKTYKTLKRLNIVKSMDDLTPTECLELMNNLFRREMSWIYGGSLQHILLNFIYFSDESIDDVVSENKNVSLFRTYFHSILHILYLIYGNIQKNSVLRDEDFGSMYYPNAEYLKRVNVLNEIKSQEQKIREQATQNEIDKKTSAQIINRLKIQKLLITIFEEQLNSDNKEKYDTLIIHVNELKKELNVLNLEYKVELDKFDISSYFCDDLMKVYPNLCNNTSKDVFDNELTIQKFTSFISDLQLVFTLYESTNLYHLLYQLDNLSKIKPSFIIRLIIDLNVFVSHNNLFGKFDLLTYHRELFQQLKIKVHDDNFETLIVTMSKELIRRKLKNQAKQITESLLIIDNLTVIALESHKKENELAHKSKQNSLQNKSTLTNFLLGNVLTEMFNVINLNFKVEMFKIYELDYVFFVCENIIKLLSMHNYMVVAKYGEKVLKEQNMAFSTLKKKFSTGQKMFIDQIYIYNTLKVVFNSLKLLIHYIKVNHLIKLPKSEYDNIKGRITHRFPYFSNCGMFIDISYDAFINDIQQEESEGDFFNRAGENIKGCAKYLSELKTAPSKLRDSFIYDEDYINNLSKAIIANRLMFLKIKKLKDENKIGNFKLNMNKYDTFLPVIEIV